MTNKLLTPLKIGELELEHRIVLEWPLVIDPLAFVGQSPVPTLDAQLSGGLAIFDPGSFVQHGQTSRALNGSGPIEVVWRNVVRNAKSSRQSALARLRGDLSFQIPDLQSGIVALTQRDIETIIGEYVDAAYRAKSSGFDGIELDGSLGSISNLFLMPSTNSRSDRYGGAIVQRLHFLIELVEALAQTFGRDRLGIRLSPFSSEIAENARRKIYGEVLKSLHDQEIAYIHIELAEQQDIAILNSSPFAKDLRKVFPGILITSCQQSLRFAIDLVESRWADAACFFGPHIDAQFLSELRQAQSGGADP